jgi:hypothetical protein
MWLHLLAAGQAPPDALSSRETLQWLIWLLVLLVVALSSTIALRRFSGGLRRRLFPRRNQPSEYTDAWKMHRLPDQPEDDDGVERN